jgi:hypothetical protein
MPLGKRLFSIPLLFPILLPISGCLSTQTDSPVAETIDSLGISHRGAREANIRLAYQDGLAIEQAADSIIRLSPDRSIKLSAHTWKIYAIPVIRQVYSQSEPLLAATDALGFSMQCQDYFTTGPGKARFGEHQSIAVNAVRANLDRLVEVNRQRISAVEFDSLMARLSRWVALHPIMNDVFDRRSVFADLDKFFVQEDYSIGSAVGRIADDVDDLSARLSLLAAQLPREARWQGEYMLADLTLKERLGRLDTTIAALSSSLDAIEAGIRDGTIVLDIASFRTLHSDIETALGLLSSERAILVTEVERIRLATLAETELVVERRSEQALARVEAILDRAFWKVGIFLSVGFVGAGLLLFLLLNRRGTPR